jgi:GH24 family phage-related lysozyme (muramidase)
MTLRDQIVRDEGRVLHLYYDHGVPHIGVGCNLMIPVPADIAAEITISQENADRLLDLRIAQAAKDLYGHLPWTLQLDEIRKSALIAIVFNMGIGNLLGKNAEAVLSMQRGDYADAKRRMLGGTWEQQVGLRAVRLMNQLVTGEWQ